jgi:hypothetical protein
MAVLVGGSAVGVVARLVLVGGSAVGGLDCTGSVDISVGVCVERATVGDTDVGALMAAVRVGLDDGAMIVAVRDGRSVGGMVVGRGTNVGFGAVDGAGTLVGGGMVGGSATGFSLHI